MTDLSTGISTLSEHLASIVGDRVSSTPLDDARLTLYGGAPRTPAIIVQPRTSEEVARILPLLADSPLPIAVRAGGTASPGVRA